MGLYSTTTEGILIYFRIDENLVEIISFIHVILLFFCIIDIVDVNNIDDRVKNYNNDAGRDAIFDVETEIGDNSNTRKNDNKNYNFIEFVRPLYVITVVEEDDRDLPKLLLQVSAPNNDHNNSYNNYINSYQNINNNNKNAISYSLNTNNGDIVALNKLFFINSTTGELFLIRPLDRDLPLGNCLFNLN
jgi:hypothetical protein